MAYYGVSVEMIKYMKEIYRDVRACVKVGSHQTTDCFPSIIGLRQGDKWSCIGFVLFLNDLVESHWTRRKIIDGLCTVKIWNV